MRTTRDVVLVGFMTLAAACAPAAPAGLTDADRTAIRAAVDQWVQLTTAKDWAGAAKAYLTEDGVMLPPNGPALNGQAAVATWLAAYPPFSDFTTEDVTVEGLGDLAYVHGRYSIMVTPPGATAASQDRGKHVTIFRKQADGSWKATLGIFNSDLPLPAAAPAPQ